MNKRANTKSGALGEYLDETGALPDDALIGHIVMFTIMDTPIERDALAKLFADNGLETGLLPPPVAALDAFKKATTEAKATYTQGHDTVSVMCRDLGSDTHRVKRQITVEVRDTVRQELDYSKGIECIFFRPQLRPGESKIDHSTAKVVLQVNEAGLDEDGRKRMKGIGKEIKSRFTHYFRFLDGNKIRAVVRNYLKHINAIELRGGVYFVPVNHLDELRRLRTLVNGIGNGCNMLDFALVDIPRERELIVEAFQKDAAERLGKIVADIADLRDTRKKITPAAYSKVKEEYDTVMSQAQEYMVRLELNQDVTAAHAEVALASLEALQEDMLKEDR